PLRFETVRLAFLRLACRRLMNLITALRTAPLFNIGCPKCHIGLMDLYLGLSARGRLPFDGLIDAFDQRLRVHRLGEETYGAFLHGACADALVMEGGHEYDRRLAT